MGNQANSPRQLLHKNRIAPAMINRRADVVNGDISDKIDDISINKKSIKPIDKNEKNIDTSDEKKYRKQIEYLEISHQEIEKINEKLYKKLNLLNSKFIKKTGVFASGYELNLTTEEYQKIFE